MTQSSNTSTPNIPSDVPLGKSVSYPNGYNASLLFPISRAEARSSLGLDLCAPVPFTGWDLWNAYELSWLNAKGLPKVALLRIKVPTTSPNIMESKSFKLYLNSFNQSHFNTVHDVFDRLRVDLQAAIGSTIDLEMIGPDQFDDEQIKEFDGINLDKLDVEIDCYEPKPSLLKLATTALDVTAGSTGRIVKNEKIFSRLLKSNCPVTDQPDWACIEIEYSGPAIDHGSLLKYIVSYRLHNGFHEHCVEKIFMDIMSACQPDSLSVYARYTRRGGLDINPWRATPDMSEPTICRSARQ